MILMYRGSGRGSENSYAWHGYEYETKSYVSFMPPFSDLSFLRTVNVSGIDCTGMMIGTRGFNTGQQEIVTVNTQTNTVQTLCWTRHAGLMYPTLSSDGKNVAVLAFSERRDKPPRNATEAKLVVVPVPEPRTIFEHREIASSRVLSEELPAIPIDWSGSNDRIFYTAVGPLQIKSSNLERKRETKVQDGLFPRISPNGGLLAFMTEDRRIVVVDAKQPKLVISTTHLSGHPGWLAWHPDSLQLAYTEQMPLWKVHINLLHIESNIITRIASTSIARDLNWLEHKPNWQAIG